ncbi:DUF2946 domain-containing protein [Oxalicibacterium flavum]|uniref:DUF2946 domain-containing protein n=1 Tax=Oxalicibacterium flavum TaxID=179467 RepID=UPI00166F5A41|nr:DUF2946 domain-containing protein [Oxalicibacterium flavum]
MFTHVKNRRIRLFVIRMACLAILMMSLAPLISHAIATDKAQSLHQVALEICTADGSKTIVTDHDHDPLSDHGSLGHLKHCPFCVKHAVPLGLLPGPAIHLPIADGTPAPPASFSRITRSFHAWASAQPRAPPGFS